MEYIKPPCIALCKLYHCMFCFIVFFFLIGSCLIGCAWHWEEEQLKLSHSGRSLQVIETLISLPLSFSLSFSHSLLLSSNKITLTSFFRSPGWPLSLSPPSLFSFSLPLNWPLSSGAQDDLDKMTQMAYRQVVEFGMSPIIGHISLPHKKPSEPAKRMYSDKLARMIDQVW